jgi:ankyrin repeat protein
MLQHGAHADHNDSACLQDAVDFGFVTIARSLLAAPLHAARADAQGGRALIIAAGQGHEQAVRTLLDTQQFQPNGVVQRAARVATANGHVAIVAFITSAVFQ